MRSSSSAGRANSTGPPRISDPDPQRIADSGVKTVMGFRREDGSFEPMHRPRPALSLVEVVVALAVLGVAVATLAAALLSDVRLRALSHAQAGAGRRSHDRIEMLAVRRCTADTAGAAVESWGAEAWRATRDGRSWYLKDSLVPRRSASAFSVEARVACAE